VVVEVYPGVPVPVVIVLGGSSTIPWHHSACGAVIQMFCVGDVKAHDNCKAATECLQQHGIPTFQDERPPVPPPLQLLPHTSLKPRLIRAPRTKAVESVFSAHAREGFVYWVEEDKVKGGGCGESTVLYDKLREQKKEQFYFLRTF